MRNVKLIRNILVLAGVTSILAACACPHSVRVQPVQRKDKLLSCKEIVLEINEAEYYRRIAAQAKTDNVDIFSPFCQMHSLRSAEESVQAADKRLEYLNQIYDLMGCNRSRAPSMRPPAAPPVSYRAQ